MWWTLGLWPIAGGVLLLYLSFQNWYINWVQERIQTNRGKTVKMERQAAIYLIIFGIVFVLKRLI
jgi:hypothetical protein